MFFFLYIYINIYLCIYREANLYKLSTFQISLFDNLKLSRYEHGNTFQFKNRHRIEWISGNIEKVLYSLRLWL